MSDVDKEIVWGFLTTTRKLIQTLEDIRSRSEGTEREAANEAVVQAKALWADLNRLSEVAS